ncbi:MAG: flagellar export protein FliJ [Pyrinomonadaceae bacterium]
MKRFHFQLQTVHDIRESQRDRAERELAEAAAQVSAGAARLNEAERQLSIAAETYAAMLHAGVIDSYEAAQRANYILTLTRLQQDARTRLAALEREREEQRLAVVEASRAAETTSRLRERQHARHNLEVTRQEQNMLDEIATSAIARQMRN